MQYSIYGWTNAEVMRVDAQLPWIVARIKCIEHCQYPGCFTSLVAVDARAAP